jgi:hypothetical protein
MTKQQSATTWGYDALLAELHGDIVRLESELANASDRIGRLELDVRLGMATQGELDTAKAAQAARLVELDGVRAAVDAAAAREREDEEARVAERRRETEKALADTVKAREEAGRKALAALLELEPLLEGLTHHVNREAALARRLEVTFAGNTTLRDLLLVAQHALRSLPQMPHCRSDAAHEAAERIHAAH